MTRDRVFDLAGEHVEPRDDDHVLGPFDEAQPTVGIRDADVAGAQPTVSGQHARGCVVVFPIAREHVRPAYLYLAGITLEHVALVLVDETHFDARKRRPDRTDRGSFETALVETTGDASVRPYPSCTGIAKRSRMRAATAASSAAATETHNRTDANASAPTSSGSARPRGVHRRNRRDDRDCVARTRSSVSAGWKWSTSDTAAPASNARSSTTFRPKTWKNGSTPNATSSLSTRRPGWPCNCSKFASNEPCVSLAAFGGPAVPR